MSIVENIKLLCKNANTSIPKLEKELNFGNGSIYNWDKNSPATERLQKVADYFKVSTDYLLGKNEFTTPSGRYINVPLDKETMEIMFQIPLLSETNKKIIAELIQSMIKNQG
jgi:transcriptional regulator with XRE-family HTH domain